MVAASDLPFPHTMACSKQRYRITASPIEANGLPCSGRCTIEFERTCDQDWMRLLEASHRQRGLAGDDRAALTIGLQLLKSLRHRGAVSTELQDLQPQLDALIERIQSLPSGD